MAVTIDNGASTFTADYSTNFALIEKIAKQSIWQVQSTNPLQWIDKGLIKNGVAIEDAVINLVDSTTWASETQTGANLNAPSYPTLSVTYHETWNGRQFKTTYSEDQFRKVLLSGGDESEAARKIVSNLTESEGYEDYQASLAILSGARGTNILPVSSTTTYSPSTSDFILAIKNTVDNFTFVNSNYVAAGFKTRAPWERIHIIMSYNAYNAMNVEYLAALFNLEKAELLNKITLIDETGYCYVVDQFALLKYTRLYRMTSKFVEDGLYNNYWLTVDRMYGSSNLFKAAYLAVSDT